MQLLPHAGVMLPLLLGSLFDALPQLLVLIVLSPQLIGAHLNLQTILFLVKALQFAKESGFTWVSSSMSLSLSSLSSVRVSISLILVVINSSSSFCTSPPRFSQKSNFLGVLSAGGADSCLCSCRCLCHWALNSDILCLNSFRERFASASLNLTAISSSCRCATELSGVASRKVFLSYKRGGLVQIQIFSQKITSSSSRMWSFKSRINASFSASRSLTFTSSCWRQATNSSFWAKPCVAAFDSSQASCFAMS